MGAFLDDDGGSDRGALWVLFLNADGTVKSHRKIASGQGGFTGMLDDGDRFGISAAALGDQDGDGAGDAAVGAWFDGDGGGGRGAVWVLFLGGDGPACEADFDGSGAVDVSDLVALLLAWGTSDPAYDIAPDPPDGTVDVQDLVALLTSWGPCS